jgi:PAS domain S-box-containing protein
MHAIMTHTVKAPAEFASLFDEAEKHVASYFARKRDAPEVGRIDIEGQRYVLVRAPSLSVEFYDAMDSLYPGRTEQAHAVARNLLFHLSHFIGVSDARAFHRKLGLVEPVAKLSAGPVHFAYTGWAFVDIHPESNVTADESYCLVYDHPYSFEAESWREAGRQASRPVCFMNAGYSSGWCEESFGIPLVATEILCVARGDPCCRFLMGHPAHIRTHVTRYLEEHPVIAERVTHYEVPGEFEHRELEHRLQVSESRYRQLFEAALDSIVILDHGRIEQVNDSATMLFDRHRADMRGRELVELSPPTQRDGRSSREVLDVHVANALAGTPQIFPYVFLGREGATVMTEVSLNRIEDAPGALLAVIRDVTERERLAQEVRHLQQMEALGTLAGGVAHNFNNLLTGVSGNLSMLRRDLARDPAVVERIDDAQHALDRSAAIVRQLLALTRTTSEPMRPLEIDNLVAESTRLMRETIDRRIEIEIVRANGPLRVLGDSNGIAQALVNLMLNARDAVLQRLEETGESLDGFQPRIVVETALEIAPPHPVVAPGTDGPTDACVRLSVIDNGAGMSPATMRRACEPFFTTKPQGRGTGLGLTTVFGIAQHHGGCLDLRSEAGHGTTVSLFFPHTIEAPTAQSPLPYDKDLPHGTETLLFVDDEPVLRKITSKWLVKLGFTVLLASDGAEALSVFEKHRGSIDLVILDVVMPRLSGREVLRTLTRVAPHIPVILSSGYSSDGHAEELLALGATAVVPKPYQATDLAWKVRQILDERKRQS